MTKHDGIEMTHYGLYLPQSLLDAIKLKAEKRDWSANKWIVHALTTLLKPHNKK